MIDPLPIQPLGPFRASVRVPGSKSLTNRALLLAALSEGVSILRDVLLSDDSRRMIEALKSMGFNLEVHEGRKLVWVEGCGGKIPAKGAQLMLGNAGTAMRPLTAACCLGEGDFVLDGVPRMRERPIGQLVDQLRQLGASIDYLGQEGYPPLRVHGRGGLPGGLLRVGPTLSSQYITALLVIAPYMRDGLTVEFDGAVTSAPYVLMTLSIMYEFGLTTEYDPAVLRRVHVPPGRYQARQYAIEPDASSASYFLAAAAVVRGSTCTIEGLGKTSLQGDVRFADVLHAMGAGLVFGQDFITVLSPPPGYELTGVDVDMSAIPDMALTLAAIAPLAKGRTAIRNVGNLRVKETDRLTALKNELTKVGCVVNIVGDDLIIDPPADGKIRPAAIDTYDDHRMAMSFAVLGLAVPGIEIRDPGCVAKTFPDFFEYLGKLTPAPPG